MSSNTEKVRGGQDLLRAVEALNRERNIPTDIVFQAIEKALRLAIRRFFDDKRTYDEALLDEEDILVTIDRQKGVITAQKGDKPLDPTSGELGRIAAQAAKQLMIQMFREEESTSVFNVYAAQKGELVQGTVQRFEGGAALVNLGKVEAILPRSEQIPGETHHNGEKIRAVILEVKKVGHRVKIILSRTHPDFVRRLFEREIPEIDERTIEMKAIAREAGYRTKVAVSSIDMKVDCVGACVGVRGSRIKNIVEVLGGERIDIVRWNDSLQVLIPNALQPAQIEEVFLYPRLGRAVVLVKEDQLSLAIGRRGQNVRLASKLVGWDIEIMTHDELDNSINKAETWFLEVPGISEEMVEALIEEGFLSYDDLTFLEPAEFAELTGVTEEQADDIIGFAEDAAERVEHEARTKPREQVSSPQAIVTPQDKAAKLFSGGPVQLPAPAAEPTGRAAFESLFAPAPPAETQPVEEQLEPAQPEQGQEQAPEGGAAETPAP